MYGLWKQKCQAIAQSKWAGTRANHHSSNYARDRECQDELIIAHHNLVC